MVVNPDVDGYAKTQNHLNIFWKNQKNTTYWKPK